MLFGKITGYINSSCMKTETTTSLLAATGQRKKLGRGGVVFLSGACLLWSLQWAPSSVPFEALMGAGVALSLIAIAGALYATMAVRCPNCRLAWVRWSVSNQPHTQWLHWLYCFESCPKCGYSVPINVPHLMAQAENLGDAT